MPMSGECGDGCRAEDEGEDEDVADVEMWRVQGRRRSSARRRSTLKRLCRLAECYDPEIPVNVVDLGLIYGLTIQDAMVDVTITSPPSAAPSQAR